jgi:ribosomal-protein-alanine N-acetyltransferase
MAGVSLTIARDSDGKAVGFSLVRSVADESELLLIGVLPEQRRRGIGNQLLDAFLAAAKAHGARRVHLEVRDGNPAVQLYGAAQFVQVGKRRNYYHSRSGGSFDALTLARPV